MNRQDFVTNARDSHSEKVVVGLSGANGFLGSALRARLGMKFEVVPLVRESTIPDLSLDFPYKVPSAAALNGCRVTHLIHCAFDFSPLSEQEHERVNIAPYRCLLNNARKAGIKNVLLVSSLSAFDGTISLYGKTKLRMEQLTSAQGGLSVRPGLIYCENPGGLVGGMIRALKASRIVPVVGDGSSIQYTTHVEDLASVLEDHFVSSFSLAGKVVYVANPRGMAYEDLLKLMAKRMQLGRRYFLHLPWRMVWAALALAEKIGMRAPFRSDSVLGLVHGNPEPIKLETQLEGRFRDF